MRWKHKFRGGLVGFIGFLLSPLSWWNDLFVNVPLALAFAWLVSLAWPAGFGASFVLGYWLTNVLGFVLMHQGAKEFVAGEPQIYSRRELVKDALISLAYTLLIVVLIRSEILKPLPDYLPAK
ncbi:MAG: hypothetical protein HZA89_09020 [Verrucomicrobia bacterium]|nr:hypothetical protein [Verrucomicrobiota bacterium]